MKDADTTRVGKFHINGVKIDIGNANNLIIGELNNEKIQQVSSLF